MKTLFNSTALLFFIFLISGCDEEAPLVKISENERLWIPYTANQQIQFANDRNQTVTLQAQIQTDKISRSGKDPSAVLDQEQISLTLHTLAPHTFNLAFSLRPYQLLIGSSIDPSGSNAVAILENKINGYELTHDKYGHYTYIPNMKLMGKDYKYVFYYLGSPSASSSSFREYYYGKGEGLIAFKINGQEDWYYLK